MALPDLHLVRHRLAMGWRVRRDTASAVRILARLEDAGTPDGGWRPLDVIAPRWTPRGITVVMAGPEGGSPQVAIKLPHSAEGERSLGRQQEVLERLRQEPRLAGWDALVPTPLGRGRLGGQTYFVESAVPGSPALRSMAAGASPGSVLDAAASTVGELHRRTFEPVTIDVTMLRRWVDEPLRRLAVPAAATPGTAPRGTGSPAAATPPGSMDRLRERLWRGLEGRRVHVSWVHGDYWPGNLTLPPSGAGLIGVLDWDRAATGELPWHDALHLLLYTSRFLAGGGPDDWLALATGRRTWSADEARILAGARGPLPDDDLAIEVLVLLYWLRHTEATVALYPFLGRDRGYVAREIAPLLEAADRLALA